MQPPWTLHCPVSPAAIVVGERQCVSCRMARGYADGGLQRFGDGFLANFEAAFTPLPQWSAQEDEVMRAHMPMTGGRTALSALAKQLGKSTGQISGRMTDLQRFEGVPAHCTVQKCPPIQFCVLRWLGADCRNLPAKE